jgi:aspartate aminotransferase-like enzyme
MPCEPQNWGVDALASTTQKGLVTPPGVGLAWLSPRAWERVGQSTPASYYFDLNLHRKYLDKDLPENPYTPPVSLLTALDAALGFLSDLGHSVWFESRRRFARSLCAGAEALGFVPLVARPEARSAGVTALRVPGGKAKAVREAARELGVELAGGQGPLKGEIIRVAHYSDTGWPEVALVLGALYGAACQIGLEPGEQFIERAFQEWKAKTR